MTAQKFIFKLMEFKVEQLYDDCFYVKQKKWGTWDSFDKEGNCIITSLTEESCVSATRQYLKWKQENRLNDVGISYEGTVGGKL
jgi:hypothetical protein